MKKYRNIAIMIVVLLLLAVVAYVVLADPTSVSDCHMYIDAYPNPIYNPYPATCLYFPNVGGY